jgi:hypothetical protein
MKLLSALSLAIAAALLSQSHAAVVHDVASNYGGSFLNGDNGGTGFLPWSISQNNGGSLFAGSFIGDSTSGAGDINTTANSSFGLFANPTAAFVDASRAFATSLATGETFSFDLAVNLDNGTKGFNLFAGSQGEVMNFNILGGASVSSSNTTLNPGSGAGYDYGGNDAVIEVAISVLSATQFGYQISRTSSQGIQGSLFSGTVSGLTDSLSGFAFYVAGTDSGAAQNNLYFNNLQVVPEPSVSLLAALGGIAWAFRRRA